MSNYAYVATRARSRRSRLIPSESYSQLLNLGNSEIARYIQDLEYRSEIDRYGSKLSGADLIEVALVDNLAKDVGDFLNFSTGKLKEILQVYAERYRVDNLKNILRGINQGMKKDDLEKLVCPLNSRDERLYYRLFDSRSIEDMIQSLEGTSYHSALSVALEARSTDSLQPLEDSLDKLYYDKLVSNLPSGGEDVEIYRNFVQLKVDIANLKTVLRMRHRQISGHSELFIDGGTLNLDTLSNTKSVSDILLSIEGTKFYEILESVLNDETLDLNKCVKSLDKYLTKKTKRFSYIYPLSVLPVLDYLLKKEREVYNLRAIVRGKQAGLDSKVLEELVVI